MKGLIKTHKNDATTKIRPVVNSINGPCYKLTFLLYSILKPVEAELQYCITNSEELINKIEMADDAIFNEYPYAASLDVKDMYTNIPNMEAAKLTVDMATNLRLRLHGLMPEDMLALFKAIFDNNFFKFNGQKFLNRCPDCRWDLACLAS
jgi:hypothetical protein